MRGYALAALFVILIITGCTYNYTENKTNENATTVYPNQENETQATVQNITPAVETDFAPENFLRIGERFRYNDVTGIHDPSGTGDTISIWIDGSTTSKGYYLKPRYLGADLTYCPANDGEKYLLVRVKTIALKNSAYTPYTDQFTLIDDKGEIYPPTLCLCNDAMCLTGGESGLHRNIELANLYTFQDIGGIYTRSKIGRSEIQAMILFTVPDTLSKSSSYIILDTGETEAIWSLSDFYADISLKKGYDRISITADNGRNMYLAKDITVSLAYPDGSITDINTEMPDIGDTAVLEVSPGFESAAISANLYSGDKIIIYRE